MNHCSDEVVGFLPLLSYDSLLGVLSYLSVQDMGRLAQVSKGAFVIASDNVLWHEHCRELEVEWGKLCKLQASSPPPSTPTTNNPINSLPPPLSSSTPAPSPLPSSQPSTPPTFSIKCSLASDWKGTYYGERDRLNIAKRFVGIWSEKWCDVDVECSTSISHDGTSFIVTYQKNKFKAKYQTYDSSNQTLTFHLEGGDSGWSFVYHLTPQPSTPSLNLKVFRIHDGKVFYGAFVKD